MRQLTLNSEFWYFTPKSEPTWLATSIFSLFCPCSKVAQGESRRKTSDSIEYYRFKVLGAGSGGGGGVGGGGVGGVGICGGGAGAGRGGAGSGGVAW